MPVSAVGRDRIGGVKRAPDIDSRALFRRLLKSEKKRNADLKLLYLYIPAADCLFFLLPFSSFWKYIGKMLSYRLYFHSIKLMISNMYLLQVYIYVLYVILNTLAKCS